MSDDANDDGKGNTRKVSGILKKYWIHMQVRNKIKYIENHLRQEKPYDFNADKSIRHINYSKIIKKQGIEIQEIITSLSDKDVERLERELALWLFRAWLAAPGDPEFHHKALLSFLRMYAGRLELAGRGLSARDAAISTAAATLYPRNSSFYGGIYMAAGGSDSVRDALDPERWTSVLEDAAKWMFEIIIMLSAFHAMREKIGSEEYKERASREKGYKIVSEIPWAPDISIFRKKASNSIMERRKDKTIKDNIRKSGWDGACIAYAIYSLKCADGKNFLENLIYNQIDDKKVPDMILEALRMARYAFDKLVPEAVKPKKSILPYDMIPFQSPQGLEESTSTIEKIFKASRGRPRR